MAQRRVTSRSSDDDQRDEPENESFDLAPLRASLRTLDAAAGAYEHALSRMPARAAAMSAGTGTAVRDAAKGQPGAGSTVPTNPADKGLTVVRDRRLAELNRLLYSTERAFRHDAGLPRREWFKHLAYAPGFYTGYGVKTLPGIREGIEQEHWDEARSFIPIVARAIDKLAADVKQAAVLVGKL